MWDQLLPLPFILPENQKRHVVAPGIQGTEQTVAHMRKLVTHAKRDGRVRKLSIQIIEACPNKNFKCYAQSIHNWIVDNIKYLHDPPGVETLVAPWLLLEHKGGDCDDHVMLFCALCEAAGIPARFVTIMADPGNPGEYSHVFSQAFDGAAWITSDTTMPQHPFGWDPGPSYPRRTWPASLDKDEQPMSGNGTGRMGRLGAENPVQQQIAEATVPQVIAGALVPQLLEKWREVNGRRADLESMIKAIDKVPADRQGPLFDMWNRAQAQVKKEQASLQDVMRKHDALARSIQTWSAGKWAPKQTGLGAGPLVVVGVGAAAVIAAAWAFSTAMAAWRGDAEASKGYLTQLSDALRSLGVAAEKGGAAAFNVGILVLVGAGGYLLYQVLKKRGTI